jgi:uncharacterized membrane protein YgcG
MRRYLILILVFLLGMLAGASAFAQSDYAGKSLVIESFHADVIVGKDGSIDVTETIRPRFTGSWNGIFRMIPVQYYTQQGMNYSLLLDLISITDEAGNKLEYSPSRQGQYLKLKIRVPGASDATRTVIINYRVENALRFFEEYDELYWNVTGDQWEMPIESASAKISLPEGVANLRGNVFTGAYRSTEQAAGIEIGKDMVSFQTSRPLNYKEGLTIAVAWNPGVVQRPSVLKRIYFFLRGNWIFFAPLLALVIMYRLWETRGRDPRLRPIAPQYEPPDKMTPAELGTLLDNSADMRDITATIVDLAVRGYMLIEEVDNPLLGLISKKDYIFTLRKKREAWGDELQPHERKLLDELFSEGLRDKVAMTDLQNTFYSALPHIRDHIFDELLRRHYYLNRPDKVKQGYIGGGIALAFIMGIGGVVVGSMLGMAPGSFIAAAILTGIIILAFGWFMPARTYVGSRALEGVLGFEDFLNRVEGDRIERLDKTPQLFEKFLPYAMALGVEKKWAAAFANIYKEPPDWYHGGDFTRGFFVGNFVSNLNHMSTQTASAMASAPRSSGGSGFGGGGGGGFSGGGFGGGGGGGW